MFGFGGFSGGDFDLPNMSRNMRSAPRGFSSSIGEVGNTAGQGVPPAFQANAAAEQQLGLQSALGGAQQQAMSSVQNQMSSFFGGGGGSLWDSAGVGGGDASKWQSMIGQLGGSVAGGSLGSMFGFGGGGAGGGWSRGNSALPMQTSELRSRQGDIMGNWFGGDTPESEVGAVAGEGQAQQSNISPAVAARAAAASEGQMGMNQEREAATREMQSRRTGGELSSALASLGVSGDMLTSGQTWNPSGGSIEEVHAQMSDVIGKAFDWGGYSPWSGGSFGGKLKKAGKKVSKKLKQFFSW